MSSHRKEIIAARQHQVRLWLIQESEFLPVVAKIDEDNVGRLAAYRWYRFAQLALFRDGALLDNDAQWAIVEKEMNDWPMMLWVSILDVDTTINEAKKAYNQMTAGRFTITQHTDSDDKTRDFKLVEMGWAQRNMRRATQMQIWKWLGPVGGEYPARPAEDDE